MQFDSKLRTTKAEQKQNMKDVSQEERREEKTTFKVGWRQVSSSTTWSYCYKWNKEMITICLIVEKKSQKRRRMTAVDSCPTMDNVQVCPPSLLLSRLLKINQMGDL